MIAKENDLSVETEGYWTFDSPKLSIPFDQVTEEMIVAWIEKETMRDGVCVIKSRLQEQLDSLSKSQFPPPPWQPQTLSEKRLLEYLVTPKLIKRKFCCK